MDNKTLYNKLLSKTGICIVFTIVGMLIGLFCIPPTLALISLLFILGAFIALLFMKDTKISMTFCYVISTSMGVGISPSIAHYVGKLGVIMVFTIFITTCLISIGLSLIGYRTNKDLSYLEFALFIGLGVLIVGGLLNIVLQIKILHILLTLAGIIIFSLYIIVDTKMALTNVYSEEDIPMAVMNLYLDFINLLLHILEIVAEFSDND